MTETIQPSTRKTKAEELFPALTNPAVAPCTEVWQRIHAADPHPSPPFAAAPAKERD